MSDTPTNHFSKKCEILADLWLNHRSDDEFQDFIEYNDIGLPLAYAFTEELAKPTEIGTKFVDETYDLFLQSLDLPDIEWQSLEDMFAESQWQAEAEDEKE
jgi:hypothetical protein